MGVRPRLTGLVAALAMLALDQGHKFWMLATYGREPGHLETLGPYFDVVMAWNPGISYSLFSATTPIGRFVLLAVTLAAIIGLGVWLWFATKPLLGLALGLLIGGALGNAWDRYSYGAVADFFHFHMGGFSWYVFNLADCGIVAGVGLLLYDSFRSAGSTSPAKL